ncbi:MAG: hypothetical protein ACLU37_04810 [Collinsella sp.]
MGSLCENNDKLAIDRRPPEVRRATCSSSTMRARTGSRWATTTTAGSSVPRLMRPDGSGQLIRCAEEPRDYFATFDCFPADERLAVRSSIRWVATMP